MAHLLGALLDAMQVSPQGLFEFGRVTRSLLAHCIGLDVLVQELVRIALGSVRGQIEQLEFIPMLGYPLSNPMRPMYGMAVYYQKHLALA